jgi:hypothetical protein
MSPNLKISAGLRRKKNHERNKSAEHERKKQELALFPLFAAPIQVPEVAHQGEDERVFGKNATYRLPQKSPNA